MVIVSSLNGPDEEYVQEWFPQLKLKKKKKIVLIVRHKIMIDHKTISIHKNYVFYFQSREELIHFHLFGYLKKKFDSNYTLYGQIVSEIDDNFAEPAGL